MLTLQVIACIGIIKGAFLLFQIRLNDFTGNIFHRLLDAPKGIREEILEETKRRKKSYFRREIEEVQAILKTTDREELFPLLCTASLLLFAAGAAIAVMIGNVFLVPVLACGFLFLPFWYIRLTASHFKKDVSSELETALSIITTAYLRSEDILTSVEENLEYLNPPVKTVFADFVSRIRLIDPDLEAALEELKGKIENDVFMEWVDALKSCLYDRSLKTTLTPIVAKLSDMRIVNAELEYLVFEPRKEFITMVVLAVGNIPLLYFLNQSWYDTLMHTIPGQIMLAVTGAIIFVSTACGLFLLLSGILKLPTLRTGRAMMQSGKKEKKLQKTLDAFYMDGAAYLGKYIGMNAYKKSRMQNVLNAAGLKMTPETYMAYAYLKAGSIFLLILPALHVFPLLAIMLVLLGVMVYYKETRKAEELVREKREQIEGELYRFVSTITQELKNSRDVLSMLEHYKENAGEMFQKELDIVCADMRSSSYEAALTRFEARLNSPQLSDVVRGLIGVLRGDDGAVYFQMLTHDFKQAELQRLKAKAAKIPPKIRVFSFAMLLCFLATYFAIIGYEIIKSMGTLF